MPAPFPMPVTTASAPPARRTAVAPCRDRRTIASSIAVTTRAATRPASFELSCPSALQFNQLLQNPGRKGQTEVSGRTPIVRELLRIRPSSTLLPWPCGRLVLLNRMLLTETTVDAETAEPVDGAKVLINGVGDLSVNDAVIVVKAADRLVGGHEGLDGLIELSLKDVERVTGVVASPFEAQLSLLLATPRVAGGEGLRSFSSNARIVLSGKAARLAGRYNCYADFLFEETGDKKPLVVECQGRLVHSGADAAMSDSDRATALQQMGFNVMLLTYQQIADEKNFEIVKRMLFEEIGLEHREKTDASLMRSAVFVASSLSIGTRWGAKVSEPCPYLCSCETLQ